ncbi:MAG: large conductance mechanosensitive channel protein MscL [Clostridia bacterium]|nr:large conductance mechanosensitive channel protein MscL [Clostridia bacterium]
MSDKERKTGKFMKEFKEFIAQGNALNLAIGVIIGGAFGAIVNALIENIVNPIIACFGGTNIGFAFEIIPNNEATKVDIGSFISAILNFIIIAFIVFCIMKSANKAKEVAAKRKKEEEEEAPTTKTCPFCKSEIDIEATKCPHCTSDIPEEAEE